MAAVAERSMWVDDEGDEIKVTYVSARYDKVYYRYTDLGGLSVGDFWTSTSNFVANFKPKDVNDERDS